jgi:GntR family transcriptional regulator
VAGLGAAGAQTPFPPPPRHGFVERYVAPLVAEAGRLGIDPDELIALIRESSEVQRVSTP